MKGEHKKLLSYAYASTEGCTAAREGKTLGDNPYPEDDERHWRWMNAWCNELSTSKYTHP